MRLLSLESMPRTCDDVLKFIQEHTRSLPIAFVTAGPAGDVRPRPSPAPGDPYTELSSLLQRIVALRLAVHRNPEARALCLLDGWIPAAPVPHPVLEKLAIDIARAAMAGYGIDGHDILYFRGCPHESFERSLEHVDQQHSFRETCVDGRVATLGDLMGARERADLFGAEHSPFVVRLWDRIELPTHCDENPLAVEQIGRRALQYIAMISMETRR